MSKFAMWLSILLAAISVVNCARILVANSIPAYSHQTVFQRIIRELSGRGHEIVFITTHPINDKSLKNVREIDVSFSIPIWINAIKSAKPDMFNNAFYLFESAGSIVEEQLQHDEVQGLIKNKTERFDLVMLSYQSPGIFAFKARFNCPFIAIVTLDAANKDHVSLGNGVNSAAYPDAVLYRPLGNALIRRLYNFCLSAALEIHKKYVIDPKATEVIAKAFGEGYPDSGALARDVDLVFMGANLAIHDPRPVTGCTVFIGGGIHIKKPKALPKDLKSFLDKSERGVIYMSLGSNLQSAQLPDDVRQVFIKAFAELPYDILWKYENESSLVVPKNMFVMKWMPQQDVLRHNKIKLFITHGGLQSIEEAILNQIPMIAIPFFADQTYNAHKVELKQIGVMFNDLSSITSEKLMSTVMELIQNPVYKNNIKRLSEILVDQPMKPMEKVVWWTEYVLRHKGAKHLRGPDLPTYQLYLLDVFGTLLLVLLVLLFLIYKIFKCVYTMLTRLVTRKLKVL